MIYTPESASNQSTYSTRSHESSNPSSKNVLPNLHDALKLEKLKKIHQQFLARLKEIETKEKSQYKAVRMIVALMLARESLEDEDVKTLRSHFLDVCALKIKAQNKKLEKAKKARADFHRRNIQILETFADYIQQMLDASLVSEEFLHQMLSFIFRLNEVKGGIDGRRDVQEGKIQKSLEYLQKTFNLEKVTVTQQDEIEEPGEKEQERIVEEEKEAQKVEEEDLKAVLEGEQFVEASILDCESLSYKRIAISLEREQEKEIKYAGRLSKTQSQKF